MNRKNPLAIPYFDNLPDRATPALQSAFDKAQEGYFGTAAIYRFFCNDMSQLGLDPPLQPIMTQWIEKVRKGDVFRPGGAAKGTVKRDHARNHPAPVAGERVEVPNPYRPQMKTAEERAPDVQIAAEIAEAIIEAPAFEISMPEIEAELIEQMDAILAEDLGAVDPVVSTPPAVETYQGEPVTDRKTLADLKLAQSDHSLYIGVDLASGPDRSVTYEVHEVDTVRANLRALSERMSEHVARIKEERAARARVEADLMVEEITEQLVSDARKTAQELVVGVLRDLAAELERGAA